MERTKVIWENASSQYETDNLVLEEDKDGNIFIVEEGVGDNGPYSNYLGQISAESLRDMAISIIDFVDEDFRRIPPIKVPVEVSDAIDIMQKFIDSLPTRIP